MGNKGDYIRQHILMLQIFSISESIIRFGRNASDLLEMVVEATKYKIELQLKYPREFAFLMKSYTEMQTLPEPLRKEMVQRLNQDFSRSMNLTDEVIGKLPLRKEVREKDVIETIYAILK